MRYCSQTRTAWMLSLGLVSKLSLPGLRSEVGLAKRDDRLLRVGILHDEVAGIA